MEPQNNPNPLRPEPGRRYFAGRVRPRAGADVRREVPSKPITAPSSPPLNKKTLASADKSTPKERKPSNAKPALPRTAKSIVLRRQMVERAKQHKHKVRKNYGKHVISGFIILVIAASLGAIVWTFRDLLPFKPSFLQQSSSNIALEETPQIEKTELEETPPLPRDIVIHTAADSAPRILRVPSLELEARVRIVGTALSGEPIAPNNIFDVGWFEINGKPDEAGVVLLNGHSIGPTKNGIFGRLHELKPGDLIFLERGDKSVITYTVSKVQQYPVNQLDMSAATQPIDPTKKGLNLTTTNSKYSSRSNTPYKQLIVFTIQQ